VLNFTASITSHVSTCTQADVFFGYVLASVSRKFPRGKVLPLKRVRASNGWEITTTASSFTSRRAVLLRYTIVRNKVHSRSLLFRKRIIRPKFHERVYLCSVPFTFGRRLLLNIVGTLARKSFSSQEVLAAEYTLQNEHDDKFQRIRDTKDVKHSRIKKELMLMREVTDIKIHLVLIIY